MPDQRNPKSPRKDSQGRQHGRSDSVPRGRRAGGPRKRGHDESRVPSRVGPPKDTSDAPAKGPTYQVYGKVTDEAGRPVAASIVVYWQRIRDRPALAKGSTSESGEYRISYTPPPAVRPLLIVVEAAAAELEPPLASPPTAARAELEINLQHPPSDRSEFARLLRAMKPLLEGLSPAGAVESDRYQDISFLARGLKRDPEQIMRVVMASRLEEAHGLPAAAFYAFLRQRVPSALPPGLLDASERFTLIDALTRRVGSLILDLPPDLQLHTLSDAVGREIISSELGERIPELVERMQSLRTADTLDQPYLVGKATLSELLDLAQLPPVKQRAFAEALARNRKSMREFWRLLGDGTHGLSETEAAVIERTLSLGAMVKNHVPLLRLLLAQFAEGRYQRLSDLARLTASDWLALVQESGAPPTIDQSAAGTPAEVFARVVYARATRAFPTIALASRVTRGATVSPPVREPLRQFFAHNADLDLVRHNVAAYLHEKGSDAFTDIPSARRDEVVAEVKRLQRVLRVTPEVDAAETLLQLGFASATQIATTGRQQFFRAATGAGIANREANRLYDTAALRYANLVSLYTQMNRDAIGVWPQALGRLSDVDQAMTDAIDRDQSLATLFGSQDYCTVDSCTSILSPAAYLCDLLDWLSRRRVGPRSALDILNDRRPDIAHLKLNCPNSETPLPFIDLVNELLADAISPPLDPNSTVNPRWKQTSADATAAELRAAPEFFNAEAYVVLFGADYPHALPYSEGLDELRTYLQESRIPLWQLRQALLPLHNPSLAARTAVAAERFQLPPHGVQLITTANFAPAATVWNVADPVNSLVLVDGFRQAASLDYEGLLDFLEIAWVRGGVNLTLRGVSDTCDTSVQTLDPAPLDPALLDRAHRFLRLWRGTGYKMWELDLLLRAPAVANGTLDANGLVALGDFRLLQDATGLAVDQQLAFFQDIDTAIHRGPKGASLPSLYARVFLGPAVSAQHPDEDLTALETGAAVADDTLTNHLSAIQAALGVSGTDANGLCAVLGMEGPNTLTLANLSRLYRVAQLAAAAKLSLGDLVRVARLVDPLAPDVAAALAGPFASPAATLAFLTRVKGIRESGFTLDALSYILAPPPWTATSGVTDTAIAAVLEIVRQAILHPSGGDVDGTVVAAAAATFGIANDVAALLMGQLHSPGFGRSLLGALTDPLLVDQFGGNFLDLTRANFAEQFLAVQLLDKARLIVQRLHLVSFDLTWLVSHPAIYGGVDLDRLPVDAAQAAVGIDTFLNTVLLVKLARLFTAAPPDAAVPTLYDLIAGVDDGTIPNEAAAQAALAAITGWTLADVASLSAAIGASFVLGDYAHPATYDALRTLETMIAATDGRARGDQIVNWGQTPANEPAAEAMAASALGVLRARYGDADWLKVAPAVMNPIRDRRSAALQAYLAARRDPAGNLIYGDTNGLFDHFLIDVQMTSCEVSTRVIQAYIAVQIFVERCRMNLEPDVQIDPQDEAWGWWEWMKRYRIWEAARKVFLYPENWLVEPQRPNRTEIFRTLEQEIHQNEHTTDAFETVTLKYIDRLDGIAHLIVTGTCQDPSTREIHVVARSISDPPQYYHRTLADGAWSGWVRIPLDIKAHQVVPAVYRKRLCLFWTEVKVANEPRQKLPAAQPSSTPPSQAVAKYVSLRMYFTIYRNHAWSPPHAAKGTLFDVPDLDADAVSDARAVEAIYTLKVQTPAPAPGYGATLFVDVFRLGPAPMHILFMDFGASEYTFDFLRLTATHLGRAVFAGRFDDLELRNLRVTINQSSVFLLSHAQAAYGPDAQPLLPLTEAEADPDLSSEPGLLPVAGALASISANAGGASRPTAALTFTAVPRQQNAGTLLKTASLPFRVVGPAADLQFDPASYFLYQDNRRCYFVEAQKYYWTGSMWNPTPPSNPASAPFEARYTFHRFYHPYTRLAWHQLAGGGLSALYEQGLQLLPDQVDPSGADVFSFRDTYQPDSPRVRWGEDNEILDFSPGAAYSVYNWELFFHVPFYVAKLLSQNQKFEDAQAWFHYLFDPTRQGADPVPERFWIPKPLRNLTSAEILNQRINNLLAQVNLGNPDAVSQVNRWRKDPFNPFLLADLRPVAYMKAVVMSYLDNLIAWADNLFATDSREALGEATLLYVVAAEILGRQPAAVTPPRPRRRFLSRAGTQARRICQRHGRHRKHARPGRRRRSGRKRRRSAAPATDLLLQDPAERQAPWLLEHRGG